MNDSDGVRHSVTVGASSLYEAVAAAVAAFRQEACRPTPPNAALRIEVQPPPVVHDVPMTAVDQWMRAPTSSGRTIVPCVSVQKNRDGAQLARDSAVG